MHQAVFTLLSAVNTLNVTFTTRSPEGRPLRNTPPPRMLLLAIFLTISLTSVPDVLCTKKFETATKPPPPPPAPPRVVFDQPQTPQTPKTGQSELTPQARFEYFELIAPNQNGQNYNPTLSISNPDFNVVYRPRQPQQPQRPQPQQPQKPHPQQPQRPQVAQSQRPQRPQQTQRPIPPPLYQFPPQKRPQRPNSQVVARPSPPKRYTFPATGHRFGPKLSTS